MAINLVSKNLNTYGNVGRFETDPSTWGFGSSSAGTIERSLLQKVEGAYSLKFTSVVTEYVYNHAFATGRATVELGKKYILKAWVFVPSASPVSPRNSDVFEFRSELFFGTPTQYNVLEASAVTHQDALDTWVEITQQIEVTSGSNTYYPFITLKDFNFGDAINNGGIIYVDKFEIFEYEDVELVCTVDIDLEATVLTNETSEGANDGSITVSATAAGAIEYRINAGSWQPSNQFPGLSPGSYLVEVREVANPSCTLQATFNIQAAVQAFTIELVITNETILAAQDGRIEITASAGSAPYQYSKDGGATYQAGNIFEDLPAGNYGVAVKDSTNAIVFDNAVIAEGTTVFSGLHFTRNLMPFSLAQTGNALESNYRLYCEVQVEVDPGSGLFTKQLAMALQPESDGTATFYLQQAFAGLMKPVPPVKGSSQILEATGRSLLYKVRYGDLYGDLEAPEGVVLTNVYQAVLGGINHKQYPTLHYLAGYLQENKKFLSWRPSERYVDASQEEYLTFFNYDSDIASIRLHARAWYTDGSDSGEFFTGKQKAVSYARHYEIPAGAAFNGVALQDPEKVLIKYQLWLQDAAGNEITERITYQVSPFKKKSTRYFLYLNSLGAFEVLRTTGIGSEEAEFQKNTMQAFLGHDYDAGSSPELVGFNASYQSTWQLSTGYYEGPAGHAYIKSLFDLQLSTQVYEITGSTRQRRLVLPGSVKVKTDLDSRYYMRFKCAEPFIESVYTPDL